MGTDRAFTFDGVFDTGASQVTVYEDTVMPLLDAFFSGYNATVLAYGQTGSGKTYTMGSGMLSNSYEEEVGIIPRVITDMFNTIHDKRDSIPGSEFRVRVQFIEVYGEIIRDLMVEGGDRNLVRLSNQQRSTCIPPQLSTHYAPLVHVMPPAGHPRG